MSRGAHPQKPCLFWHSKVKGLLPVTMTAVVGGRVMGFLLLTLIVWLVRRSQGEDVTDEGRLGIEGLQLLTMVVGGGPTGIAISMSNRNSFSNRTRLSNANRWSDVVAGLGRSRVEGLRLLTTVVVGGGPTGVEFAGELSDFINKDLRRIDPMRARDSRWGGHVPVFTLNDVSLMGWLQGTNEVVDTSPPTSGSSCSRDKRR